MKHTLIIVDVQYDFYHPNGTLYVKEGEKVIKPIRNIIPNFDHIIFTVDFHPFTHCSFSSNGGPWPVHCVAFTKGASIPQELMSNTDKTFSFYRKGMIPLVEEYGAFGNYATGQEESIKEQIKISDSDFVICGIAGDYCVLETIKNLLQLVPKERVFVFMEGIASIDGGTKLEQFIINNNIKLYENDYY